MLDNNVSCERQVFAVVKPHVEVAPGYVPCRHDNLPAKARLELASRLIGAALVVLGYKDSDTMLLIHEGLVVGRDRYGVLNLATDRRKGAWVREAVEELRDALVYLGAAIVEAKHGI